MAVFGLLAHASGISESRYRSMQLTTYLLFHSFSRCNEVLLCPAVVTGWLLWWCGDEHVLEGMLNRKVLPSRGFSLLIATSLSYSNSLGRFRSCIVQEMIDILRSVVRWLYGFMAIPIVVLLVMCLHQFSGARSDTLIFVLAFGRCATDEGLCG